MAAVEYPHVRGPLFQVQAELRRKQEQNCAFVWGWDVAQTELSS